jgi:hypothetical protein
MKPSNIYYAVGWRGGERGVFFSLRTKNLHMNELDFRDYPRLMDEQAENIFAITDDVGASAQDGGICSSRLAIYSNAMRQEQR